MLSHTLSIQQCTIHSSLCKHWSIRSQLVIKSSVPVLSRKSTPSTLLNLLTSSLSRIPNVCSPGSGTLHGGATKKGNSSHIIQVTMPSLNCTAQGNSPFIPSSRKPHSWVIYNTITTVYSCLITASSIMRFETQWATIPRYKDHL